MTTWQSMDNWIVLVGILSGCSCALLGNYLVLRRMSLMGDALSHAVLPGLAIAFLVSESRSPMPMLIGAVAAGVVTALSTELVHRYGKVEHGASLGVVFSILFAAGLVLIRQAADHVDLDPGCVLYGNISQIALDAFAMTVPPAVINLSVVLVLNVLFVGLLYKELKISAFDPELATTLGINATLMHYALMIMVAITTVANFEVVGSILVIAMLIVPPATAYLLTDRMGMMLIISLLVASGSAVGGHALAIWGPGWAGLDPTITVKTSAMMAVVGGAGLLLALFFSPSYGIVSRLYHRVALSFQILAEDLLGLLYRWHELQPAPTPPMLRSHVLRALGSRWATRWMLRRLSWKGDIVVRSQVDAQSGVWLTQQGMRRASQLIRTHRLWETYLEKHFKLPLDHLHMPAERIEHFITPEMNRQLAEQFEDRAHDPHGQTIPEQK